MKKLNRRPNRFRGQTVGLDLHKRILQYSVLDRKGDEVVNQAVAAERETLTRMIRELQEQGPVQVVLEASGCFLWAYDLLVDLVGREHVHVAAPSRVRVIAESSEKTDANDAWWLGYLLWEGRLPEAFVAEGQLRELRIACREYRAVTDERADLMRRFKSHLAQLGRAVSRSDWASGVGWQRIEAMVASLAEEGQRAEALRRLWSRIQSLTEEQEYWEKQMRMLSESMPEVRQLQDKLPGVGPVISAIVWSELGDPRRYHSAKAYGKASGLTPGNRISGGHRRRMGISRESSAHVRWALTRAVVACMRCTRGPGLAVRLWVECRARRGGSRKQAMVPAAKKLAEGIWRLFQSPESFQVTAPFSGGTVTTN
jgi:transposase